MDEEMTVQTAAGTAEVQSAAAPQEEKPAQSGAAPRKKKKKRPADGTAAGTGEHRRASAEGADGQNSEMPRKKKKKRPADATAEGTGEHRRASAEGAGGQTGEMPRKKKKKRPADATAEGTGEHRRASAEGTDGQTGEMPRKKKKKRPADGTAAGKGEHRRASAEGADGQTGEMPRRKKKKRPADSAAKAEHRSVAADPGKELRRAPSQQSIPAEAPVRRPIRESLSEDFGSAVRTLQRRSKAAAADAAGSIRSVGTGIFAVIVIVYIIAALLLIRGLCKKANRYLAEYESTRPQYTIESYIQNLSDGFLSDMMTQAAAGLNFTEYEKPEMLYESVRSQAEAEGEFTYQPAEDFTESKPVYYVLRNGEAIAKVPLARSGWTERYKFPVWRADEPESVISLHASPAYTLSVTMPEDSTLKVNGVEVPFEQYLETESEFQLSQSERYFMEQPMARKCVIPGLYCPPQVTVTDADGNVLEPYEVPDPDHAEQTYVFPIADEKNPDTGLTDRVTALTYAYMDYVINTRCEVDANLANLSTYMLAGSPFANLMYTIASDVWYNNDPNMREDHVFEIKHVKKYADNVCTVDVHVETTIGKVAVNDYIGTIRWVMVNNGYGWFASNISLHP